MNKKMIKLAGVLVLCLIFGSGAFIVADYYELFGTTIEKRLSFAEIRFRPVNKDTGAVVMNAGVRCFQKNNMNACTLKESHKVGVVSVNIPVQRAVKKTLLFKKAEEIYKSIDPNIHIMLIHQDYNNPTVTLSMEDVYSNNVKEQTVQMPPRNWGDSEQEEEDNINE